MTCRFSLKALSQNGLFRQSSRRGALSVSGRVFPSETKSRAVRGRQPGCLIRSKTTEAAQKKDVRSREKPQEGGGKSAKVIRPFSAIAARHLCRWKRLLREAPMEFRWYHISQMSPSISGSDKKAVLLHFFCLS